MRRYLMEADLKRFFILIVIFCLTGCEEAGLPHLAYDGRITSARINPLWSNSEFTSEQAELLQSNGIATPQDANAWAEAGITNPAQIIQWHTFGFSPDAAKKFLAAGILDPSKAYEWEKILRTSENNVNSDQLGIYKRTIDSGRVTLAEVGDIIQSGVPAGNAKYVLLIGLKVHNGMTIEQAKKSLLEAAQQDKKNNFISTYGLEVYNICGTSLLTVNLIFPSLYHQNIDPYSYDGKCFIISLPSSMTEIQWINANTALVPSFPLLIVANEHIRLGRSFIAVGRNPLQYTTIFNAVQTPLTVKILKYLN